MVMNEGAVTLWGMGTGMHLVYEVMTDEGIRVRYYNVMTRRFFMDFREKGRKHLMRLEIQTLP